MTRTLYPLPDGRVMCDLDGKLYIGWIERQKPNDQSKWTIDWREMNWPGEAAPYGEEKP